MKGISLENFPFDDAPNTAVITCCHVLNGSLPILHVSHDLEDGMWQFLCGSSHDEPEARIVSLYSIYMHDPSVARLANMPCGYTADRDRVTDDWIIQETREESYVGGTNQGSN